MAYIWINKALLLLNLIQKLQPRGIKYKTWGAHVALGNFFLGLSQNHHQLLSCAEVSLLKGQW